MIIIHSGIDVPLVAQKIHSLPRKKEKKGSFSFLKKFYIKFFFLAVTPDRIQRRVLPSLLWVLWRLTLPFCVSLLRHCINLKRALERVKKGNCLSDTAKQVNFTTSSLSILVKSSQPFAHRKLLQGEKPVTSQNCSNPRRQWLLGAGCLGSLFQII